MDESTPEPLLIPDPEPEEIVVTDGAPSSYEDAVERLEEIIDRLDSGQAGLRETLDLCKEGKTLVDYCAGELDAVGKGLKELNLDDLAAKLDSSAGPGTCRGPELRPAIGGSNSGKVNSPPASSRGGRGRGSRDRGPRCAPLPRSARTRRGRRRRRR